MKKITCVNASDFPDDVEEYLVNLEVSTHYQNSVTSVIDDGNPFAEWLKKEGYTFSDNKWGDFIAIIAT